MYRPSCDKKYCTKSVIIIIWILAKEIIHVYNKLRLATTSATGGLTGVVGILYYLAAASRTRTVNRRRHRRQQAIIITKFPKEKLLPHM